ncbi:hypothetical protein JV46_08090 [Solemya velum gill symbiont]|uniref:Uncharacterized protein n=1 Tax=Solemya velum gill symbiont TaxID=2340 RepID=A0A0B0HBG5_SOVGS|nr:hypothetical protein JV46_08090 [Solemya velum gill symbiont]
MFADQWGQVRLAKAARYISFESYPIDSESQPLILDHVRIEPETELAASSETGSDQS